MSQSSPSSFSSLRKELGELEELGSMAGNDIQQKLVAVKRVISDPRLRTLAGKQKALVEDGNVYGERVDKVEFQHFLDQVVADETVRQVLLAALRGTALSVEALSERTRFKPNVVFKHLLMLQQKGQVTVERIQDHAPLYRSVESA